MSLEDEIKTNFLNSLKEDAGRKIAIVSGGIGDFIAIDSFLTDAEKRGFDTVYQIGFRPASYKPIFTSYHNVSKYKFFWECFGCKEKTKVMQKKIKMWMKPHKNIVAVYSMEEIFKEVDLKKRHYNKSFYIDKKLTNISKFNLPSKFAVICPSTINAIGRLRHRKFTARDWDSVRSFLTINKIKAVVLGVDCWVPPNIDNLVNLSNKTSILESIEIAKKCSLYIGVDSMISVIVSKTLESNNTIIKTLKAKRRISNYYKPNGATLVPSLKNNFIQRITSGQKITLL